MSVSRAVYNHVHTLVHMMCIANKFHRFTSLLVRCKFDDQETFVVIFVIIVFIYFGFAS